eukprot:gene24849-39938_t
MGCGLGFRLRFGASTLGASTPRAYAQSRMPGKAGTLNAIFHKQAAGLPPAPTRGPQPQGATLAADEEEEEEELVDEADPVAEEGITELKAGWFLCAAVPIPVADARMPHGSEGRAVVIPAGARGPPALVADDDWVYIDFQDHHLKDRFGIPLDD